jgi:hypothetical protein
MSPATAAKRWTCDRCGMAVGQIDGTPVPLPESWERGSDGEFCLACRRARAAEEALAATPDECSTDVRAKARRAGLIEFEVRRTPTLTDNTIARACRTSASAVAAARKRLDMGESPPPSADRDRATARRATASRG